MEVEEIQTPACKFARVGNNGRNDSSNKIGQKGGGGGGAAAAGLEQYPADDEEDGVGGIKRIAFGGGDNRLRGWHHHSSRIYRVSRASGGKDRHSKVVTSKGLRDRRVRLSVSTAIAFYDLQDRLGYDQPSKAVEWLIKAAAEAIAELPSLNSPFSDTTLKQLSDGKRGSAGIDQGLIDSADVELDDGDPNYQHQHQHQQQQQLSLSKSACSSTSETSKGSGLSLSRPDARVNRVKARERARERAAKEKEKENESLIAGHQQQNVNPMSQNSFTELLNAGLSSVSNNTSSTTASGHQSPAGGGGGEPDLFHKQPARHHQQWPNSTSMSDYFATGFLGGGGGASSSRTNHHSSGGFLGQIQLGNSMPQSIAVVPPFSLGGDSNNHHHHHHHQELQHYSFLPDHLTTQPGGGNDYNRNFTISSSSLAGFNRGTLQSNLVQPSVLSHNHLQRFSTIDGSNNLPFFTGTATAAPPPPSAASAPLENHHNLHFHHQFAPGFDGRSLQLYHGDGSRHSDQKGKEKN